MKQLAIALHLEAAFERWYKTHYCRKESNMSIVRPVFMKIWRATLILASYNDNQRSRTMALNGLAG